MCDAFTHVGVSRFDSASGLGGRWGRGLAGYRHEDGTGTLLEQVAATSPERQIPELPNRQTHV